MRSCLEPGLLSYEVKELGGKLHTVVDDDVAKGFILAVLQKSSDDCIRCANFK